MNLILKHLSSFLQGHLHTICQTCKNLHEIYSWNMSLDTGQNRFPKKQRQRQGQCLLGWLYHAKGKYQYIWPYVARLTNIRIFKGKVLDQYTETIILDNSGVLLNFYFHNCTKHHSRQIFTFWQKLP